MKKAAIYARYSSDNQREESIEAQVRAINDYCDKNGYSVVKIYTDEAKSATSDDRPQFQQMIKDSSFNIFDAVIVHKLDRFSRDRYDSAFYKRELKKNKVKLVSVLENLDDSPESIILESVLEGMAEYYSANLSREVMKGMKETAYQCKHTGGTPPLGYDVLPDKTYAINEYEAETVRIIFDMAYKGASYPKIIECLEKAGRKTKLGNSFTKTSLNSILRNEKYSGVYVFNKTGQKVRGKRNVFIKSEDEIIRIDGGMPLIISKDIFLEVNKKMDECSQAARVAKKAIEIYLLSGKIKCGECGATMRGNTRYCGRNKNKYVTYDCQNRRLKKGCSAKSINARLIENMVIDYIEEELLSYLNIDRIADKAIEYNNSLKHGVPQTITAHKYKLKEIQNQIDNIVNAIASGMFHSSMKDKMDILESKKVEYETKISNLELQLKNYKSVDKKKVVDFLESQKGLYNKSPDDLKLIIQTFIDKVSVYGDHIEINSVVRTMYGGEGNRTPVRKPI